MRSYAGIVAGTAADGSPVELYSLLPEQGEGELLAEAVPEGGTILELGCGAGRITRQLLERGYRVTAVDESAEMLAHVRAAETVEASIEELDLGRRFDAALLASNLVNAAEPRLRQALLDTCARHASLAVIETLPLGWEPRDGTESLFGDVVGRLAVASWSEGIVRGEMAYEVGARRWTHAFAMRVFADDSELDSALAAAGLRLERWLDRSGWFLARRAT